MDNIYMKGELLQIYIKNNKVVEGRFYSMTKDKSRISLYEVKELPRTEPNENVCHYYEPEIRNIVKIKETGEQKYLKISQNEYEEIIKLSKGYVFINQVDEAFHKAMEEINQYDYVAVSTDGANMGRLCKMPFLVVSTPRQIYIFDIQVMEYRAFDAGLKKLLESESPNKIIHDCRKLSDCLWYKHNVKLNSVFDTQVGDIIITRNKTGCIQTRVKPLAECLNAYLGLKPNTIEEKLDLVQCTERPLSTSIKETLAKNNCFLHRLSEMINDEMMLPFIRGVNCYVKSLRSVDHYKAWEQSRSLHRIPEDFKLDIEYY